MIKIDINNIINNYVVENLSPKQKQRAYISEKYEELKGFLADQCFQSGSYARFTAIHPVHDLDIVYTINDTAVREDASTLIATLVAELKRRYASSDTKVQGIYAQTHSVTIELAEERVDKFSIDIVPAIILDEKNGYGKPLFLVPEIFRLSHSNRQLRYAKTSQPIDWIKSDPYGYILDARTLNDANSDFRHSVKLLKGWRHACKTHFQDRYKLKSFHLEQIVYACFAENPDGTTLQVVVDCLANLASYINTAQIADRADKNRLIDQYVNELTSDEKELVLLMQNKAYGIVKYLPVCKSEEEVAKRLKDLTTVCKEPSAAILTARSVAPQQPWAGKA